MSNIIQFIPRLQPKEELNQKDATNSIINFTPKSKSYSDILEPKSLSSNSYTVLNREQAIIFYSNYLWTYNCLTPEEVRKKAKQNMRSIQHCGHSFLIHDDIGFTYITLKEEINIHDLKEPDYNRSFNHNILYILAENLYVLDFDNEEKKFFTWFNEYEEEKESRKLFLMPLCFSPYK